jgi:hypothetical protein
LSKDFVDGTQATKTICDDVVFAFDVLDEKVKSLEAFEPSLHFITITIITF